MQSIDMKEWQAPQLSLWTLSSSIRSCGWDDAVIAALTITYSPHQHWLQSQVIRAELLFCWAVNISHSLSPTDQGKLEFSILKNWGWVDLIAVRVLCDRKVFWAAKFCWHNNYGPNLKIWILRSVQCQRSEQKIYLFLTKSRFWRIPNN